MKLILLEQYTVHDKNLVLLVLCGFVLAENVLVFTGLCVLPHHTHNLISRCSMVLLRVLDLFSLCWELS